MKNKNKLVKDLVSILIPVYNVEKYLPDLFLSIENQAYPKIEVIFVNDGSTDNSLKLLNEFCKKHSYARVISEKNMGVATARNRLIKNASGTYVYFLDADDIMSKHSIKEMIKIQKTTGCDLVTSNYKRVPNKTTYKSIKQNTNNGINFKTINGTDNICSTYLSKIKSNFSWSVWNKLFLTNKIRAIKNYPNIYDPKICFGEDLYFLSQYLLQCNNVKCINKNLYFYRLRSNSITHQKYNKKFLSVMYSLKYFICQKNKLPKTYDYARAIQAKHAYWLYKIIKKNKIGDFQTMNWLYKEYTSNALYINKCFKISKIVLKARATKIKKYVTNLNKHEKRKN